MVRVEHPLHSSSGHGDRAPTIIFNPYPSASDRLPSTGPSQEGQVQGERIIVNFRKDRTDDKQGSAQALSPVSVYSYKPRLTYFIEYAPCFSGAKSAGR